MISVSQYAHLRVRVRRRTVRRVAIAIAVALRLAVRWLTPLLRAVRWLTPQEQMPLGTGGASRLGAATWIGLGVGAGVRGWG